MKIFSILQKNNINYFQENSNNNLHIRDNIFFGMSASLIGKHFDDIGTIISQPKLLNIDTNEIIPCSILHSSTQNGGTFHLIKDSGDLLSKVQGLLKAHPEILEAIKARFGCIITPTVEKIISKNKELTAIIKQELIAEVSYMKLSPEDALRAVEKLGYKKNDEGKDIFFLQNLVVSKPEYKNAMKTVTTPLLKGLVEKGIHNILLKASAFGENAKSPIHLYEFFGFKPLNITKEEVEKHTVQTVNGRRLDPNYRIMMYLPQNAVLYSILNKLAPLEISNINPNWFKI